jgi:hypothetical protein
MRLLILFLLACVPVLGLGITPAEQAIIYNEPKVYNITYKIYNTECRDMMVTLSANGTLAKYMEFDRGPIRLAKVDRYKVIEVKVNLPDSGDYKGTLIADNAKFKVSAQVSATGPKNKVTGHFIKNNTKKPYLVFSLLGLIIVGNLVYFAIAKLKSKPNIEKPEDLIMLLKSIDDTTFDAYVKSGENEFADWLDELGQPELALKIYDLCDRQEMIRAIEEELSQPEAPRSSEEIKEEILLLKHELDEFKEKDL